MNQPSKHSPGPLEPRGPTPRAAGGGGRAAKLSVAALLLAACGQGHAVEAPPGSIVAGAVESSAGDKEHGVLRCDRDGRGCRPVATGDRFEADALLKTTRGARATFQLDGASLDLEGESAVLVADRVERLIRVDRGSVGYAAASAPRPARIEVMDDVIEPLAGAPVELAILASAADRATVSLRHGRATVRGPAGEPIELSAGDATRLVLGKALEARAAWTASAPGIEAAPTLAPAAPGAAAEPDPPPPAARGLGTMTARVPGTGEVVSGVRLASHHVEVTVRDGFARTQIEEEFANDGTRVLEGRYVFPLPPGASVSRLALWVGSSLVEGEIVERRAAARIFKGIVDDSVRPRDPALLEWTTAGEFALKVFPLPPHGSRKVLLAYDQALPGAGGRVRYVYPLSLGADRTTTIGDFSFTLTALDTRGAVSEVTTPRYPATITTEDRKVTVRFAAQGFAPTADLAVGYQRAQDGDAQIAAYVPAPGEFQRPAPAAPQAGAAKADAPRPDDRAGYAAVRLTVDLPADLPVPARVRRDRAVVVDTSFSQSRETFAGEGAIAAGLLRHLEPDERFVLLACDSACAAYPEDGLAVPDAASVEAASAWLAGRSPRGSTDLAGALLEAARRLPDTGSGQVVYVGDGSPSAGELRVESIAARTEQALGARHVDVRLLGAGRSVDEVVLGGLAAALGGTYERVTTGEPLAQRIEEVAAGLRRPVITHPRLELPGYLTQVYPRALPNLRLGQEVVVVGRLDGIIDRSQEERQDGKVKLTGELGGKPYALARSVGLAGGGAYQNPLVPRLWAEARIEELSASEAKEAVDEVVDLSRRFHVMSRQASLLVLENDAMFAEFGIQRTTRRAGDQSDQEFGQIGLTQAPPAGGGAAPSPGLSSEGGAHAALDAAPVAPWGRAGDDPLSARGNMWGTSPGPGEAFGAGGLGLSGIGEGGGGRGEGIGLGNMGSLGHGSGTGQGFGSGHGRLGGRHVSTAPKVRSAGASVSGRVPPEVIQRVVRGSVGRMRACYEKGLRNNPKLEGRVAVRFVILTDGSVGSAGDGGSSMPDAEVVACVVRSVTALTFPAPDGGIVTVVYPVVFSPGDAPPPAADASPPTVAAPTPAASPPPVAPAQAPVAARPAWQPRTVVAPDWAQRERNLRELRRLLAGEPEPPSAFHRAGDERWRAEGEGALERLRRGVDEAGASRGKHDALVRGLLAAGRFPEALAAARRFAELDPDFAPARELLAYAEAAGGDGPAAVAAVDSQVETDPSSASAHLRAARAYEAAGDERRACAHWRSLADLGKAAQRYEALRCRARVMDDREAALREARALVEGGGKPEVARPGAVDALAAVKKLVGELEAGPAPAFAGATLGPGQLEATLTCAAGVEGCPTVLVLAPSGAVLSPWTPGTARSGPRSIALPTVRDGTYRTLIVGGSRDATGELELRAFGAVKKFAVHGGDLQTIAATVVSGTSS